MNNAIVPRSAPVLMVLYGNAACGPCRALKERLTSFAQSNEQIAFSYRDLAEYAQEAAQLSVFTAPTLLVYVQGELTLREAGCFSLNTVFQKIERYLRLLG